MGRLDLVRRASLLALGLALALPTASGLGLDLRVELGGEGLVRASAETGALDLEVGLAAPPVDLPLPSPPASPQPSPPPQPAPAAAAAVVAVESAALARLAWLVGLGLFTRLRPQQILDHAQRGRVLELVRAEPGIGPSDVMRRLGLGWGTVSYHLDRLERAGLIVSERSGHHRCYFAPGALDRDARKQVGAVRGESARQVAALVLRQPGLTQSELCAALGLSASAASKQVSRLEEARLVRRQANGARGTHVYPEPSLAAALAPAA